MSNQALVNYRVISSTRLAVRDGAGGLSSVPALIKRILKEDMWREFVVAETGEIQTYTRFADFVTTPPLEGMGTDLDIIMKLCKDDAETLDLLNQVTIQRPGQPSKESIVSNGNNTFERPVGNTRRYALRKLATDAPEYHARVVAGELSPHAAMIEAGFRSKSINVPAEPERAARALLRHFNADELREIVELVLSALED